MTPTSTVPALCARDLCALPTYGGHAYCTVRCRRMDGYLRQALGSLDVLTDEQREQMATLDDRSRASVSDDGGEAF